MIYSRRNFLKAAGSGIALTAVGEGSIIAAAVAPLALPAPMTSEKSAFACGVRIREHPIMREKIMAGLRRA